MITLLKGVSRFPGPPDPVITTVRVWDRVFSTEGAAFLVDKSFRPVRFGNHKQKSTDARAETAGDGQSGESRRLREFLGRNALACLSEGADGLNAFVNVLHGADV